MCSVLPFGIVSEPSKHIMLYMLGLAADCHWFDKLTIRFPAIHLVFQSRFLGKAAIFYRHPRYHCATAEYFLYFSIIMKFENFSTVISDLVSF